MEINFNLFARTEKFGIKSHKTDIRYKSKNPSQVVPLYNDNYGALVARSISAFDNIYHAEYNVFNQIFVKTRRM